jgi:hypothetical protein
MILPAELLLPLTTHGKVLNVVWRMSSVPMSQSFIRFTPRDNRINIKGFPLFVRGKKDPPIPHPQPKVSMELSHKRPDLRIS